MSSIGGLCQYPAGLFGTSEKEEGKKTAYVWLVGPTEKLFATLCYCAMCNRELLKDFKQTNGIKEFLVLEHYGYCVAPQPPGSNA